MRHGKKFNHLGRKAAHRKSMLANMACSLILHKRIKTTLAKAKALRVYVEPLITKSKNDTTHSRRVVFSYLKQKDAITELFGDISSKVSERNGGYTRILKLGNRLGDNATMCYIELVDYNSEYVTDKPQSKKSRRSRRKSSSASDLNKKNQVESEPAEEVEATPSEEVEAAPSEEVEAAPSEEVEAAPSEEVEAAPSEEVEATPSEEVEAAPSEEVEAASSEEVEEKSSDISDEKENKKDD